MPRLILFRSGVRLEVLALRIVWSGGGLLDIWTGVIASEAAPWLVFVRPCRICTQNSKLRVEALSATPAFFQIESSLRHRAGTHHVKEANVMIGWEANWHWSQC